MKVNAKYDAVSTRHTLAIIEQNMPVSVPSLIRKPSSSPATEHHGCWVLLIHIKRIKYTQKHLNLGRGKRDIILYFQLKHFEEATSYFLCSKNVSSTRHFSFFELFLETREFIRTYKLIWKLIKSNKLIWNSLSGSCPQIRMVFSN